MSNKHGSIELYDWMAKFVRPSIVFAQRHLLTLDCNREDPSNYLYTYAPFSAFNENQAQGISF